MQLSTECSTFHSRRPEGDHIILEQDILPLVDHVHGDGCPVPGVRLVEER